MRTNGDLGLDSQVNRTRRVSLRGTERDRERDAYRLMEKRRKKGMLERERGTVRMRREREAGMEEEIMAGMKGMEREEASLGMELRKGRGDLLQLTCTNLDKMQAGG